MGISRRAFIIFLFLIHAPILHADIRFIQRFSWKADPAALEYRVEIQNTQSGKTERVTTGENFAEFSLAAGTYRYRVSVYNLLGKLSSTSEWKPFTVSESPLPKKGGDEFTQTLSWKGGGAAIWRVELENTATGERGIFETEQTSAPLSLSAGKYRYRVTPIDVLGKRGQASDWVCFEVFKANKPEIKKIEETVVKSDGGKVALGVDIANITEGSTVELIREREEGSFDEDGGGTRGKAGDETASAGTVYFDTVGAGTWRLRVTNPSGLSTESEPFSIQGGDTEVVYAPEPEESGRTYRSITLSAGVGLWFNLYDGTLWERNNVTYFGQKIVPALTATAQFLPFRAGRRDRWGFSLSFDGTRLFYRGDAYNQTTTLGFATARAVYHRSLVSDYLFAAFKAGGGMAMIQSDVAYKDGSGVNIDIGYSERRSARAVRAARAADDPDSESTDSASTAAAPEEGTAFHPCVHAGLSLVWVPFTRLSVEAGADFTHIFANDMPTGIITPYLMVGIRL